MNTSGAAPVHTYEIALRTKALVSRSIAERRRLVVGSDSGVALAEARRNLAQAIWSLSGTSANQMRSARLRIGEMMLRKENLERRTLAKASETKSYKRSHLEMMAKLPPKVAVIDFLRTVHWSPPGKTQRLTSALTSRSPAPAEPRAWSRGVFYDCWVVRNDRIQYLRLADAQTVDRAIGDLGVAINRGDIVGSAASLSALRRLVWDPIERSSGDFETAIILPDGRLASIPWVALPGRKENTYLIEDYAVATAPHAHWLIDQLDRDRASGNGLLVVGDVEYGSAAATPEQQRSIADLSGR